MLLNTLKMLVMAGNEALKSTCGLSVTHESITQIRHGSLTFPSLGELRFTGGTLQKVYLGCDAQLLSYLAETDDQSGPGSGLEILSNRVLENVLNEMAGRRPRGWVEHLEVGPLNLQSRGVRTFGFRLQTQMGELYLMADVPSRMELDLAKEGEFLTSMVTTYFPGGWASCREMKAPSEIDNFLVFLRKTEVDIQVEVPAELDMYTVHTGVLLKTTSFGHQRALCVSMDVSGPEGKTMQEGDVVQARVGIQDRAITFSATYLGTGDYPVAGSADIKCVFFSMPSELKVEQRRRAFRIHTSERIPVEVECMVPAGNDEALGDINLEDIKVKGRLADLSFSGARIIIDQEKLMGCSGENSHVLCRILFPGKSEPLEIMGIIRRAAIRLIDRDTRQDEIGIEFLVSKGGDRLALEHIRQYVLSQQRSWLSKRIHVVGVEQW